MPRKQGISRDVPEGAVQRLERFTRIQGEEARRIVDTVLEAIETEVAAATPGPAVEREYAHHLQRRLDGREP